MDLWALFLRRAFGLSSLDYAMVGRWLGHMPAGQFAHARIADAREVSGERIIGWSAHYATGIAFAAMLLAACGSGWAREPTLAPALAAGLLTVAAPFLIMQPGLGLGIAASRTPAAERCAAAEPGDAMPCSALGSMLPPPFSHTGCRCSDRTVRLKQPERADHDPILRIYPAGKPASPSPPNTSLARRQTIFSSGASPCCLHPARRSRLPMAKAATESGWPSRGWT